MAVYGLHNLLLSLTLSLLVVPSAFAFNLCSLLVDPEIHIYQPTEAVDASDSQPLISRLNDRLENLLVVIKSGKGRAAQIYAAIKPQIEELLQEGKQWKKTKFIPQEELFRFAEKFSRLIYFPTAFGDKLGYHEMNGFDYMQNFTVEKFELRWARHKELAEGTFAATLDQYAKETFAAEYAQSEGLTKIYVIVQSELQGTDLQDLNERNYFFQYKYHFIEGLADLADLFATREQGKFILGVRRKPYSAFDGTDGSAEYFLDHDRLHAFFAKINDSLLFEKLRVTTIEKAREVKKINHGLLMEVLKEWLAEPHPKLRAAIKVALYSLLHEEGRSYPLQVRSDLVKHISYFEEGIFEALTAGRIDNDIRDLLGNEAQKYIADALTWLKRRAKRDVRTFNEEFRKLKLRSRPAR